MTNERDKVFTAWAVPAFEPVSNCALVGVGNPSDGLPGGGRRAPLSMKRLGDEQGKGIHLTPPISEMIFRFWTELFRPISETTFLTCTFRPCS
ncbi:hypothetical protein D3C80_1576170 [compost metagenome]